MSMTRYHIIEKLQKRFNLAERTFEEFRLKTKPLSRKKLRQLMPLNAALTSSALASNGHKGGPKHMMSYSDPARRKSRRAARMSALDGFYVVKPRRVVD